MANFGLPFVPGGDLQNDAMEDVIVYIENTYTKIDSLLNTLEQCASERRSGGFITRACRTVDELNKNLMSDDNPNKQVQN